MKKLLFFILALILISCKTSYEELDYFNTILEGSNLYEGKTVAILGDSISTHVYENGMPANVPELTITVDDVGVELSAYVKYPDIHREDINGNVFDGKLGGSYITRIDLGRKITFTPAYTDIGKTIGASRTFYTKNGIRSEPDERCYIKKWWMYLEQSYNLQIIPVCFSASRISRVGADESVYKTLLVATEAWHDSQIASCGIRIPGTMKRLPPDVVIIQRGSNDYIQQVPVTADYFTTHDYANNVTGFDDEGNNAFVESYVATINKLRAAYPDVIIIVCTLFTGENEYNAAIREIAEYMNCGLIDFENNMMYSNDFWYDGHPKAGGQYRMGYKACKDFGIEMGRLYK